MKSVTAARLPERAKSASKRRMNAQVEKSRITMMRARGIRSARIPPNGESRAVGTMERAKMPPKTAAEPVSANTWRERAKRRMAFPKREMI